MSATAGEALAVLAEAELLHSRDRVEAGLGRLAGEITSALSDANPLMLCVMTGGVVPAGCLLTRLDFPLELDYIHATRYRGELQGRDLHWRVEPSIPLRERTILLIDDILDEGHTLAGIIDYCYAHEAHRVYSCVLVDKRHDRRIQGARADFIGLEVDDRYVFGYGMDYKGYLRNAPGIYAVKE